MARELTFQLKRKEYTVAPLKIDRRKLYGFTEIVAQNDRGESYKLVSTDLTGRYMIDKGGTGMGILTPSGEWADRSSLKIVRADGTPATLVPSSFNIVNKLSKKVGIDTYLNYNLTDFYELNDPDGAMAQAVGEDIYTFTYSYLDNYEGNTAFVLVAGGTLFLLIGQEIQLEMLCVGDCGDPNQDEDYTFDMDEEEPLDFSMF